VKYNASGTALWARSVTSESVGTIGSDFNAVAVDSSGSVYAAGYQEYTAICTYGPGVSAQGAYTGYQATNAVLVKYNSSGTAQWARSVSTGSDSSVFEAVTVDSSGNVYAAGYQSENSIYTYGAGVSAKGFGRSDNGPDYNEVLVKYDTSGTAQWARTVNEVNKYNSYESMYSWFSAVAVDSSGNVYAAGRQNSGTSTYGTGVSTQFNERKGPVLVKYKN
jgi:hypothetical protein